MKKKKNKQKKSIIGLLGHLNAPVVSAISTLWRSGETKHLSVFTDKSEPGPKKMHLERHQVQTSYGHTQDFPTRHYIFKFKKKRDESSVMAEIHAH